VAVGHRARTGTGVPNPTLVVAGRQDATVGYAGSWRLVDHDPRATFAVLDRAGHALPIEQVGLLTALPAGWLDRVDERHATAAGGDRGHPEP
jgi:pimeloyl-ACP methyl ester carboxylesterase